MGEVERSGSEPANAGNRGRNRAERGEDAVAQKLVDAAAVRDDDDVAPGQRATEIGWQDFFADPQLAVLIARAVERNRDLAIAVTAKGFEPKALTAKVGQPVTLVVTRKVERTCATEIVIKDYGIDQPLPLDQPVKVTFTPTKPGKVRFACGMDMIAGEIAVQ